MALQLRVDYRRQLTMVTELSSHSRIPLFDTEPNDVIGIVMRKDILQAAAEGKNKLSFIIPLHTLALVFVYNMWVKFINNIYEYYKKYK